MAHQLDPATWRHLAIVLCLGATLSGCGRAKRPEDQAEVTQSASAPRQNPSPAAQRGLSGRDNWEAYVKKKGLRVIDARTGKLVSELDPAGQDNIPLNTSIVHRAEAGDPGADGWCVAESTRGNFSVSVPGRFSDTMIKSRTESGAIGFMHTIARKTADGTEFNVLETEVIGPRPASQIDLVQKMIDAYEKKNVTVTRKEVLLAGVRADRLSLSAKGVGAEIVLATIADSDYMLGVQWQPPAPVGLPDDIERFFSSFAVKQKSSTP